MKKIPFHRYSFDEQEIQAVTDVLQSGWITTGKQCQNFENQFLKFKNTKVAIAVNSGTAALFLLLSALHLQEGDEVITTPLTFAASANVILHHRAKVVFADIKPNTLNICPDSILQKITLKTKAIIVVHVGGHPCEMDKIIEIANQYNLQVIEDCAHAVEAEYQDVPVGNFGLGGAFSFYPNKNITTGEGGMLISKDVNKKNFWLSMRNHGFDIDALERQKNNGFKQYDIVQAGYKMNMNDIAAAIGVIQLSKIEKFYQKRLVLVQKYLNFFQNSEFFQPVLPIPNSKSAWHLMMVKLPKHIDRNEVLRQLTEKGIQPSVHFQPLYRFSLYQKLGFSAKDFLNCEKIANHIFSLPLFPDLTFEEQEYIFEVLSEIKF